MIKYLTRFTSLLAYLFLLANCVNELENTEVHVPEVKINDTLIELATQTICWSAEECLDILGVRNSELTIDKVATINHYSKIGEELTITFHDTQNQTQSI